MTPSPVVATVPFNQDGVWHGFLRLPHSADFSAWGNIMTPLTVARGGDGPTALFTGANHGDEYEGPAALLNLALRLESAEIRGRVILVPFMNYPAFRAARRTSPLDGGNMNRVFPGAPDGGPTAKIADYFTRVLTPMADIVLDFHSGGKSLEFLPFAACHRVPDADLQARAAAAVAAFNAPYSVTMREIDGGGMFDAEVEKQGKVFVTTELGGGGGLSAKTTQIARRGARNLLIHSGILAGEITKTPSIALDMPDDDCFIFAEAEGLAEPLIDLGETVCAGDAIARIWPPDRTGKSPQTVAAKRNGILTARRFPGLTTTGDCLAVVAAVVG